MNIIQKVNQAKQYFRYRNCCDAGRVLVGQQEIAEMKEAVSASCMSGVVLKPIKRAKFLGLEVYEMDDDSYLEVAK